MFPAVDPTGIRLVHETMVREEMARNASRATDRQSSATRHGSVVTTLRARVAHSLFAVGAWIAPAPRPHG